MTKTAKWILIISSLVLLFGFLFGCNEEDKEAGVRIHQSVQYSSWNNQYVFYTAIYNGRVIVKMFDDKLPVTDSLRMARIVEARAFIDTMMSAKDTTIYIK